MDDIPKPTGCTKGIWGQPVATFDRYPYTHHGPAVHGSKLADYLISELSLREDHPELFDDLKEGEADV